MKVNLNSGTLTAVIGGSGFDRLEGFNNKKRKSITTPYGDPSDALVFGQMGSKELVFLPRHGTGHSIAPHKINYRANIHALKAFGVSEIIAIAAVGGIGSQYVPGAIVIPDQIVDYTWGREHTYFDGVNYDGQFTDGKLNHIDFTLPFDDFLRNKVINAANTVDVAVIDSAVYGVTQGPRLETAAEVDRLEKAGVDVVGMTAMPEAVLARELDMAYCIIAMVVNEGAGRGRGAISLEAIQEILKETSKATTAILRCVV